MSILKKAERPHLYKFCTERDLYTLLEKNTLVVSENSAKTFWNVSSYYQGPRSSLTRSPHLSSGFSTSRSIRVTFDTEKMMANAHVLPYVSGLFAKGQPVDAQQSLNITPYASHGYRRIQGQLNSSNFLVSLTGLADGKNNTFKLPINPENITIQNVSNPYLHQAKQPFANLITPDDLEVTLTQPAGKIKKLEIDRINVKSNTFTLKETPPEMMPIEDVCGLLRDKLAAKTEKTEKPIPYESAEELITAIKNIFTTHASPRMQKLLPEIIDYINSLSNALLESYLSKPSTGITTAIYNVLKHKYPTLTLSFKGKIAHVNNYTLGVGAGNTEYEECPTKTIRNVLSCITQIDIDFERFDEYMYKKYSQGFTKELAKELAKPNATKKTNAREILLRYILKKIPKRIKVNIDYSAAHKRPNVFGGEGFDRTSGMLVRNADQSIKAPTNLRSNIFLRINLDNKETIQTVQSNILDNDMLLNLTGLDYELSYVYKQPEYNQIVISLYLEPLLSNFTNNKLYFQYMQPAIIKNKAVDVPVETIQKALANQINLHTCFNKFYIPEIEDRQSEPLQTFLAQLRDGLRKYSTSLELKGYDGSIGKINVLQTVSKNDIKFIYAYIPFKALIPNQDYKSEEGQNIFSDWFFDIKHSYVPEFSEKIKLDSQGLTVRIPVITKTAKKVLTEKEIEDTTQAIISFYKNAPRKLLDADSAYAKRQGYAIMFDSITYQKLVNKRTITPDNPFYEVFDLKNNTNSKYLPNTFRSAFFDMRKQNKLIIKKTNIIDLVEAYNYSSSTLHIHTNKNINNSITITIKIPSAEEQTENSMFVINNIQQNGTGVYLPLKDTNKLFLPPFKNKQNIHLESLYKWLRELIKEDTSKQVILKKSYEDELTKLISAIRTNFNKLQNEKENNVHITYSRNKAAGWGEKDDPKLIKIKLNVYHIENKTTGILIPPINLTITFNSENITAEITSVEANYSIKHISTPKALEILNAHKNKYMPVDDIIYIFSETVEAFKGEEIDKNIKIDTTTLKEIINTSPIKKYIEEIGSNPNILRPIISIPDENEATFFISYKHEILFNIRINYIGNGFIKIFQLPNKAKSNSKLAEKLIDSAVAKELLKNADITPKALINAIHTTINNLKFCNLNPDMLYYAKNSKIAIKNILPIQQVMSNDKSLILDMEPEHPATLSVTFKDYKFDKVYNLILSNFYGTEEDKSSINIDNNSRLNVHSKFNLPSDLTNIPMHIFNSFWTTSATTDKDYSVKEILDEIKKLHEAVENYDPDVAYDEQHISSAILIKEALEYLKLKLPKVPDVHIKLTHVIHKIFNATDFILEISFIPKDFDALHLSGLDAPYPEAKPDDILEIAQITIRIPHDQTPHEPLVTNFTSLNYKGTDSHAGTKLPEVVLKGSMPENIKNIINIFKVEKIFHEFTLLEFRKYIHVITAKLKHFNDMEF